MAVAVHLVARCAVQQRRLARAHREHERLRVRRAPPRVSRVVARELDDVRSGGCRRSRGVLAVGAPVGSRRTGTSPSRGVRKRSAMAVRGIGPRSIGARRAAPSARRRRARAARPAPLGREVRAEDAVHLRVAPARAAARPSAACEAAQGGSRFPASARFAARPSSEARARDSDRAYVQQHLDPRVAQRRRKSSPFVPRRAAVASGTASLMPPHPLPLVPCRHAESLPLPFALRPASSAPRPSSRARNPAAAARAEAACKKPAACAPRPRNPAACSRRRAARRPSCIASAAAAPAPRPARRETVRPAACAFTVPNRA